MAILPKTAVVIGPNTLSGTPQHPPGGYSEFITPWSDGNGNEFDSNASRVAIWFRTWDEAQAFVKRINED